MFETFDSMHVLMFNVNRSMLYKNIAKYTQKYTKQKSEHKMIKFTKKPMHIWCLGMVILLY